MLVDIPFQADKVPVPVQVIVAGLENIIKQLVGHKHVVLAAQLTLQGKFMAIHIGGKAPRIARQHILHLPLYNNAVGKAPVIVAEFFVSSQVILVPHLVAVFFVLFGVHVVQRYHHVVPEFAGKSHIRVNKIVVQEILVHAVFDLDVGNKSVIELLLYVNGVPQGGVLYLWL